jgi:acetylglutamate kinase
MRPIVVKYGGNAMKNHELQAEIVSALSSLVSSGIPLVVVHGGGPFINEQLNLAGIESEFVDGHRVTPPEALTHIEMALKGRVNGVLVRLFNENGAKAVGLSGKDAQMVRAKQRVVPSDNSPEFRDLGQVGDITEVDTSLIDLLIRSGITPVIACLATGDDGQDYNVNGDMMAGHVAAALGAEHFVVLTDIDGLRHDVANPETHIDRISTSKAKELFGDVILGGMIPKIESCITALEGGASQATIINGMKPDGLIELLVNQNHHGTTIYLDETTH